MVVPVEQVDHGKSEIQQIWMNIAERKIILPLTRFEVDPVFQLAGFYRASINL
jgi:hypothetical protein